MDAGGIVTAVGEGMSAVSVTAGEGRKTAVFEVTVAGYEIYVAGYRADRKNNLACYWKNGVRVDLSENPSQAFDITVVGEDIYVVGQENYKPTLWKNGQATLIEDIGFQSKANGIVVSGPDIYISGENRTSVFDMGPRVWKNGEVLYNSPQKAMFYAITLSGNDVYTTGTMPHENGTDNAAVWKNGEVLYKSENSLGNRQARAHSRAIDGADVYYGGYEMTSGAT